MKRITRLQNKLAVMSLGLVVVLTAAMPAPGLGSPGPVTRSAELGFDNHGRPTVEARIDAAHDYVFAVDTAAQRTTLGQRVVDDLGLQPDPDERAMAHGSGGVGTLDMYRVGQLDAAGHSVRDGLYMAAAHVEEPGSHGHDGILGQEFFTGGVLTLDFAAARMTVSDTAGPNPVAARLPGRLMHGGFMLVDITINGVDAVAVIDTGAAESFANRALAEALGVREGEGGVRSEVSVQGVTQAESVRLVGFEGRYDFADLAVIDAPLSFTEASVFGVFGLSEQPALFLGMDVLGRLTGVQLDYRTPQFGVLAAD